jgi:hypothetical protein
MHRLLIVVASLLVIFGLGPFENGGGNAVKPSLTSEGSRSGNEDALLKWASARFTRAGLELPGVSVAFHDQREACAGHPGLFRDQPAPRIDICGFFDFSTAAKKTILHELAHAWAHENLSDDDIEEFLDLRGLEIWAGPNAPWELKGTEHAAEIIAWALFDRELDLVTIPNVDARAVEASYRVLTGRPLPDRNA